MSDTAQPATEVMKLVPPAPSPEPSPPLRGDAPWLGDIWRPADTATIAHNFYVGGMDLFLPQINWGAAGPGHVDAELQILPWISASPYHVVGEHAWVGRPVP